MALTALVFIGEVLRVASKVVVFTVVALPVVVVAPRVAPLARL